MIETERRQTPRMTVEGLAYVNLEPDNGGIILNISEGGLCFYSTTPVQRTATIGFWFSQDNHGIDADGQLAWADETRKRGGSRFIEADSELAWTDVTRKRGGLRFTNLPAEGRKEIRNWISQHAMPVTVDEKSAPSLPSLRESPSLSAIRRDTNSARRSPATLEVLSPGIQPRGVLTGFSGGLVAGVLVSALLAAVFLLYTQRREFGQSLIHLGERLVRGSWPQPARPEPRTVSLEPQTASSETQPVSPTQIPAPRPERLLSQPPVAAIKPHGVKLEGVSRATTAALHTANDNASGMATTISSTPLRPSVPTIDVAPTSDPSSGILRAVVPQMESANEPSVHIERSKEEGTGSSAEKYLEVGKFNERLWADKTTDKLSQLGFPAMVIQKSRFWRKSYQVLVGPYGSDHEAEAVHKNLASHGFTPRSYERGRRDFRLPREPRPLRLGGTSMPVGDCVISWESYVPDAIVKFETNRGVALTVEGTWVKRGVRYHDDAVVYTRNIDGSLTLIEIRFSGMGQALVFGRGSI